MRKPTRALVIRWSPSAIFVVLVGLLGLMQACNSDTSEPTEEDPVLAQVYNKALVLSDIDGIVGPSNSPEDSLHLIQSFVDRWVHEAILMHEAEKHVRQDMNLDQLVRDYRSSLVLNNFENELFASELDTVITNEDVHQYFNANKEQFRLRYDIVRYSLIKIGQTSQEVDWVQQWWQTKDLSLLVDLKDKLQPGHAYVDVQPQSWRPLQDLKKRLPKKIAKTLSAPSDEVYTNNNYLYFLKVYEIRVKGDLPPISFVRDQVEKIILHGRKMKLIEDKKAALYNQEINGTNVRIFTN